MLVLSRQRDETVMIDFAEMSDDELFELRKKPIECTIVDIRGDKVRIGYSAPQPVKVHRKEVYEAIRRENRAAAQVKSEDVVKEPKPKPVAVKKLRDGYVSRSPRAKR